MKVKFITLGCKVNQYETAGLREKFHDFGFEFTESIADIYIINTCTVTKKADTKSREAILRAKRENPKAKVAVSGCLTVHNKEFIEKLNVDYIVSQENKHLLPEILSNSEPKNINSSSSDLWSLNVIRFTNQRAFLKIQDGCDNRCPFCKIPYLRGPSFSLDQDTVINRCKLLIKAHSEIVLCGINLSLWGRDLNPKLSLADLVKDILALNGLGRLRLSSLEPFYIKSNLLELLAEPKLCPHLHFPFQYGDDTILKLMNKKESVALFLEKVDFGRKVDPAVAISCDIMVGFAGETDQTFANTLTFLERVRPMRMHVFTFSPRDKTEFSDYKIKDSKRIKERYQTLIKMSNQFAKEYIIGFLGKELEVAIEQKSGKYFSGYTQNYIKVHLQGKFKINEMVPIKIIGFENNRVIAKEIKS